MAENKKKTYWPHMIVGFLMLAMILSYWTVKSASSMPVQESNTYMMKYQMADIHINEITKSKQAFDRDYVIHIKDAETMVMTDNVNSNRPQLNPVKLSQGSNTFNYEILTRDNVFVLDANVTFLLTQPHSRKQDMFVDTIPFENGKYVVKNVNISKPGRYTLQLKVVIGEKIGYSEIAAYLQP
ncbi:MAG: hypothetical protein COA92_01445 [Sulfurovum sp.]|nr:MAG: hypothetical protein COA92_01445 [Sulfurovum sp.]